MTSEKLLALPSVEDFRVTGDGGESVWAKCDWNDLGRVGEGPGRFASRFKAAWSSRGFYFLFDGADARLTCSGLPDLADLFREDVVELFLWPDEKHPVYFEYEISPLGAQLPVLVSNNGGRFHGWLPWHYEGERRCRVETVVRGGKREPGAAVTGWSAECFIPFALFAGVCAPPRPGDLWRANFCRIDYDEEACTHWAWDTRTGVNFHDHHNFGRIRFS